MASQEHATLRFALFTDLPPELRIRVWQHALPDSLGPALYPYKRGCWAPRHLTPTEPGYKQDSADDNFVLDFRHQMLGAVRIDIPLASATREAREVALAWAAQHDLELRDDMDGGTSADSSTSFLQSFDLTRDLLYITEDDWDELHRELFELPFQLGQIRNRFCSKRNEIYRIAVSEDLLLRYIKQDDTRFAAYDMLYSFPKLETLYLVRDPQPRIISLPHSDVLPWRCQIEENARRLHMVWNKIIGVWEVRDDGGIRTRDDEDLCEQLLAASGEVSFGFDGGKHGFEIRIVCVGVNEQGSHSK